MPMSHDFHCSSGSPRSFTDPVSNFVMISGVDLSRDLANMFQAGKYPREFMPDFIHEMVHHMCFDSPVGAALGILHMRSWHKTLRTITEKNSTVDKYDVLEDALRYETAIALMRPLAEGLALFGEFDSFPGTSPLLSNVAMQTAVSFGEAYSEAKIDAAARLALQRYRLSDIATQKKTHLLVQPFTIDGDGYLPGYLTVKNMRVFLLRKAWKLVDSDLFLSYLKAFFYDDFGLVARLLDPDRQLQPFGSDDPEKDSCNAIAIYLQERFQKLYNLTNDELLERFERAALAGAPDYWSQLDLGSDPELVKKGETLLQQALDSAFEGQQTRGGVEAAMLRYQLQLLKQRHLFCVGSFEIPVRVNEYGRALGGRVRENPVFAVPALDGVTPRAGNGSIEYFFSPRYHYSVCTISIEGDVVAVFSLAANFSDEIKKEVAEYEASLSDVLRQRERLDAAVEQLLAEPESKIIFDHYAGQHAQMVERLYVRDRCLALPFTPADKIDRCADLMRESGLYCILGEDGGRLGRVAELSVLNSILFEKADIAAHVSWDLPQLLSELEEIQRKTNVPIAHEFGDRAVIFCNV